MLALRAGEPYRVARALSLEVAFVAMGGSRSRPRTARVLQAAHGLIERVGHPHATGLSTVMEGVAAWMDGRWKNAYDFFERAEAMLRERCTGVFWEIMSAQLFQLASLFYLGEVKELSRRLPALLKEAVERGDLLRATFLRIGYCSHVAWLAADDPARAREELDGPSGLAARRLRLPPHLGTKRANGHRPLLGREARGPARRRTVAPLRALLEPLRPGGLRERARLAGAERLALAALSGEPKERDELLRGATPYPGPAPGEDPLGRAPRAHHPGGSRGDPRPRGAGPNPPRVGARRFRRRRRGPARGRRPPPAGRAPGRRRGTRPWPPPTSGCSGKVS